MFGPRLKQLLESNGLDQKAIALEVAVSPARLNRMLNGTRPVTLEVAYHITHRVGTTLGSFLDEPGYSVPIRAVGLLDDAKRELLDALGTAPAPARKHKAAAPPDSPLVPLIPFGLPALPMAMVADADEPRIAVPARHRHAVDVAYEVLTSTWRSGGILRGDVLFTHSTSAVSEAAGRLVICEIDGAADIARLERQDLTRVRLTSARDHRPVVIREAGSDDFRLVGIVVGRLGNVPDW